MISSISEYFKSIDWCETDRGVYKDYKALCKVLDKA